MTTNSTEAGQAVYSKKVLTIYDWYVLGLSNYSFWRCPTRILREEFVQHASNNHLDVGVGTGYYLDNCLSSSTQRLGLLDLNQNSLFHTSERVARFTPEIYQADILKPLTFPCAQFDSISINFLLHCLPGTITEKSIVFDHLNPLLNEKGVIFGSTILGRGTEQNFFAKKLMAIYNNKGIFGNSDDDYSALQDALHSRYSNVALRIQGCVAIFAARV